MIKDYLQAFWQSIIRILAFIGKEARLILHQPRLVLTLIIGPFLILLIFGLGYRNTPQTLKLLFVVPEGSTIESYVEAYAENLSGRFTYEGITHDPAEADRRLRERDVDLVIVTPLNPTASWENNEQSTFSFYHHEIDPLEEGYIQVIGQRYVEEINQEVLLSAVSQSQEEALTWQEDVAQAKVRASTVREALAAGDRARAGNSAAALKEEVNMLALAIGSGLLMAANFEDSGNQSETAGLLLDELGTLQNQSDEIVAATEDENTPLNEAESKAAQVETSLTEVDQLLIDFREMDANILVAPFRSDVLNVTQVRIEPMHFYVPAVIALLLQHLAVTLAGLSIIHEKLGGALELFRAAPLSAFEMLFGKYSSYLLLISSLAVILTGLIIFGLRVPQLGQWVYYILVILALLLASLGIGFHISLSARSNSQAIQFGMLTLLASIFFSGFFLPLYRLAPGVQVISWLLPATYGTVLLQDVMLRGQTPQIILLLALFSFSAILFLVAWFRLRRQMARE